MKKTGIMPWLCGMLALLCAAAAVASAVFFRDSSPVLLNPPEDAVRQVEGLMEAVCDGDFAEAEKYLYGKASADTGRKPLDPAVNMVWQAYLQSMDYRLVGDVYTTDSGIAQDVKFISLELDAVTANLGSRARELLSRAVEGARSVSEIYDEENHYREELVMEILQEAVRQALEEDVRFTYEILSLPLTYEDGRWRVMPEQSPGAVLDRFEMYMNNAISDALEGILAVDKVYWLRDEDIVAPEPDAEKFGQADDPAALKPVIEQAQKLLDGQELIFCTDTQIRDGSTITYYLDETILCVTWQYTQGKAVYTCSEVKIAHPSQFRRFLSEGSFGSGKLYRATEMAAGVNAVTASNGDYYAYRGYGNLVYNAAVKMADNRYLDTCYVDGNGDLIMLDMGELYRKEDVQSFVDEHDIRFSLAFGPILVEDGKMVAKPYYALGQTEDYYSRAALCQIGPLHYMLVTVNRQGQTVTQFATRLQEMGVAAAYALDGGQTSTIVTADRLMNPVDYGGERETSDIIYFATAIPDGG